MELKLRQKDVAQKIGCDVMSIVNWEKNHTQPRINLMAAVIEFLGYNPLPSDATIGQTTAQLPKGARNETG